MCISIRQSEDGTIYVALAGGPGIPAVDPVAERIVFAAIDAHNASIRAGRGPTIDMHPAYDESFGRCTRRFARPSRTPAELPPYVLLPARRHRSWRLPVAIAAFIAAMCLATFTVPAIFGNAAGDVSRPVLVKSLPTPCNQLASVTGPEIE